jgi:hypothetical protein
MLLLEIIATTLSAYVRLATMKAKTHGEYPNHNILEENP